MTVLSLISIMAAFLTTIAFVLQGVPKRSLGKKWLYKKDRARQEEKKLLLESGRSVVISIQF